MKLAIVLTLGMIVDTNIKRAIAKFQAFADEADLKNQEGGKLLVATLIPKLAPIFKLYNLGKLTEKELILKIQECLPLSAEKILEAWNSCCVITEQNKLIIKQIAEMQKQAKSEAMDISSEAPKARFFIYSDTNESNFEHLKPELVKAGLEIDSIITTFKTGKTKEAIFEDIMNGCDDLGQNPLTLILLPNLATYPLELQREEQNKIQMMKKIAKARGIVESQYFTVGGEQSVLSPELPADASKAVTSQGALSIKKLQEIIETFQSKSISPKAIEPLEEYAGVFGSNRFLELAKIGDGETIMSLLSPFSAEHRFQIMLQLKDQHHRTIFHILAENHHAELLCTLLGELRAEEQVQAVFMVANKLGFNALQAAIITEKPGKNQDATVEQLLKVLLRSNPSECIRAICEPYNGRSLFQTSVRGKSVVDYAIETGLQSTVVILVRALKNALQSIKSKTEALKLQGSKKLEVERQIVNVEARIKPYLTKYAAEIEAASLSGAGAGAPGSVSSTRVAVRVPVPPAKKGKGSPDAQIDLSRASAREKEELELALAMSMSMSDTEHKTKAELSSESALDSQKEKVKDENKDKQKDSTTSSERTQKRFEENEMVKKGQEIIFSKDKREKGTLEKGAEDPKSPITKESEKREKGKSVLAETSGPVTLEAALRKAIFEELDQKLKDGDLEKQEYQKAAAIVNEYVKDPENFDDNDASLRVIIKEVGDAKLEQLRAEMNKGQSKVTSASRA